VEVVESEKIMVEVVEFVTVLVDDLVRERMSVIDAYWVEHVGCAPAHLREHPSQYFYSAFTILCTY
jgi:hypothetical protein